MTDILNRVFKKLIKQSRPTGIDYINAWDSFPSSSYGMPSGHMQNVTTAATFIILFFKNNNFSIYAIFQSILTGYQRWYYKKHTIEQIITGAIIGIMLGIIYYQLIIINKNKLLLPEQQQPPEPKVQQQQQKQKQSKTRKSKNSKSKNSKSKNSKSKNSTNTQGSSRNRKSFNI
jgi:membrane-associated phospholipid phosphatase